MMRTRRRLATLALVASGAALSACDDGTGIENLGDAMTTDAALLAADATLEEVAMFRGPIGFEGLHIPGVDEPPHDRRPGPPGGHHSFEGEFSGTRAVSFFDESGIEQDAYDALTTATIHILHDVEGSIERDRFSAEIMRERDMTVSGLAGEETHRTWSGSGSQYMARSGVLEDGSERSHTAEGSFVFENVVVPIPGSDDRWPVSGTITREMTMTRSGPDGTETRDVTVVITFDGSAFATAVVNGEAMEIDLSAREGRNPLHRRPRG
jgi:hypothetical protein